MDCAWILLEQQLNVYKINDAVYVKMHSGGVVAEEEQKEE
jgi:hypothetical protein